MQGADCEVLVVGAGPAGSWTARSLARAGRDVVLADENPEPRRRVVCTGIVGSEAFRRFDLPEGAVVDDVPAALFRSPSGREVEYAPGEPLARVVDRTRFDAALARDARRAGARLLRGWAARGVEKDARGVTVRFDVSASADDDSAQGAGGAAADPRAGGGEPRSLRARALVVATGHQRWLHEAAGLGTPRRYVHGVHADLPFRHHGRAELYFGNDVAPGFFAWAVPFGRDTARLGVLAPQGAHRHFRRFLARPEIRDRLGPLEGRDARHRLQRRAIVQGPVAPSAADRVLAVGEAAGQVKTTTAGGIYYGLQGAEAAAGVLDDALAAGRVDGGAARRYEQAWRGRLEGEIRTGLRLQRAVREMGDDGIDRLFARLQGGLGEAVRQAVRFDWHRPALQVLFAHRGVRRLLDGSAAVAGAG